MVNKIVKKDWTMSDIRNRAALVNAARGLSRFLIVDFIEEDVEFMKQDH